MRFSPRKSAWLLVGGMVGGMVGVVVGSAEGQQRSVQDAADRAPDGWSRRATWRTADGWFAVAAHGTLLPDGRVVGIGYDRDLEATDQPSSYRRSAFVMTPTPMGQAVPDQVFVQKLVQPLDATNLFVDPYYVHDDLFCTGHTLSSDGELVTVGGTRGIFDTSTGDTFVFGTSYATSFDGATWTRLPGDMAVAGNFGTHSRWYPTATRLPDERILVTSGYELVLPNPTPNLSAEILDPVNGVWEVLSPLGEPPLSIFNGDYTHAFVLPDRMLFFDLLVFGDDGLPVLLSLTGPVRWWDHTTHRPGTLPGQVPGHGTSTLMLPIRLQNSEWGYSNGSVLLAGGQHGTSHMRNIDLYDPMLDQWSPRIDGLVMRHHPTSVLLPDGKIAIVAGHNKNGTEGLRRATYVDPRHGFDVQLGRALTDEVRGYHNIALLLPDGRVLVGGGQDLFTGEQAEKANFRYLYPPYMFRNRPDILVAPPQISFDQAVTVETLGPAPTEFVLMALGSMTHSVDMNQRSVQLELISAIVQPNGRTTCLVRGPLDARTAPPGYYMLFALDGEQTPSEAAIVRVE